MSDLALVFQQIFVWIGEFLAVCRSSWLLTVAVFLIILDLIVSILLVIRGGHD